MTRGPIPYLLLLVAALAALVFAGNDQTERVAADAMAVADLARARAETRIIQADLAVALAAALQQDHPSVQAALDAARDSLARLEAAGVPTTDLRTGLDRIEAMISDGELEGAGRLVSDDVVPELHAIEGAMAAEEATIRAQVEAEARQAGLLARTASFAVALIVPGAAVWIHRRAVRRRLQTKLLEERLAMKEAQARFTEDLLAGTAHQLRTPLTAIYGFAAQADDEAGQTVAREAHRMSLMLDDLLVASRLRGGRLEARPKPVDLTSAVERVVAPYCQWGVSIEVDVDPVEVDTDEGRLRHLLADLVWNAVEHGGPPVRIVGRAEADAYLLKVVDHGDGLPDGFELPSIGEIRPATTGTLGLGLAVAHALADCLGTRLTYDRSDGATGFSISLPMRRAIVAASAATSA
ncbi:MAG: hypothetical protein KatS3mg011_0817 [Acidimicrobiia bacterium]|nr:MAG: hypothetical protein KatS3mg011_0817 [Acidimicrobiia bacterium]